ncbi:50S ribosomal protein L23 [Stomatohabitans albus]|uniref:50S ribosomal protein L23 n=1 Tax=Stomatohabitans albus TaxID=3110766 RepID=UPI00300C96E1
MRFKQDVIIRPVVSEKSYGQMDEANRYTFIVHPSANKTEIKQAVEEIWGVRVAKVNTLNRKGKTKRFGLVMGKRRDEKRAMVTLVEGDSIDIFSGGL